LATTNPLDVFSHISALVPQSSVRVAVCGGDGTVGWILDSAEKVKSKFPVSILPLGTGNDLSRALRWGSGVAASDLSNDFAREFLIRSYDAPVQLVDRWEIIISKPNGVETKRLNMINYFSLGIDAEIALKFHEERQRHPENFSSQSKNVLKYAFYGFEGAFEGLPLENSVALTETSSGLSRAEAKSISVNPHWKGLVISNIPCYHGGKDFWGDADGDSFLPASTNDERLEIMGLAGTLHIGLVHLAVDSALRLAQVGGVRLELRGSTVVQVDGEPWRQEPGFIEIRFKDQCPMLAG